MAEISEARFLPWGEIRAYGLFGNKARRKKTQGGHLPRMRGGGDGAGLRSIPRYGSGNLRNCLQGPHPRLAFDRKTGGEPLPCHGGPTGGHGGRAIFFPPAIFSRPLGKGFRRTRVRSAGAAALLGGFVRPGISIFWPKPLMPKNRGFSRGNRSFSVRRRGGTF